MLDAALRRWHEPRCRRQAYVDQHREDRRALLFEHYVEDISRPEQCRVVSISDFLNDRLGQATVQVTWELKVASDSQGGSTLTNHITTRTTDALERLFAQAGITVAALQDSMHHNAAAHNAEETALFAADIARRFSDDRRSSR